MGSEEEAKKLLVNKLVYNNCLESILSLADDKAALKLPVFLPLCDQLAGGISLCGGTIKFRLNIATNTNRLFILPKILTIYRVNDPRYWTWIHITDHITAVDGPKLISITKLDIRGKFSSRLLTQNTIYVCALLVIFYEDKSGWETPVNVSLTTPDGKTVTNQVSLERKPIGMFFELPVGEFTVNNKGCEDTGLVQFAVTEYSNHEKRGLLIKGCLVRAKFSNGCTTPTVPSLA